MAGEVVSDAKFEVLCDILRELGGEDPPIPLSDLHKLYGLLARKSFWGFVKKNG